jgi:subtilase family serine protease
MTPIEDTRFPRGKNVARAARIALAAAFCAVIIPLIASVAVANYNFDGTPLSVVAQGQVQGDVLTFGTYGLRNPLVTCNFSLPADPEWARIYVGVWGGTYNYTGWGQATVNGNTLEKTMLYGKDDKNANVFCSGYGVYWITYEGTSMLKKGANTVIMNTSYAAPGNKLDGRVYMIWVVAVVEDAHGSRTSYWIADGNMNLHSAGWAGTNPTIVDQTSVSFSGVDASDASAANLTVVELCGTKLEPDYLLFNGKDLLKPPASGNYIPGAMDLANAISYDQGVFYGQSGISAAYVDAEVFDVKSLLGSSDTVTFQRGRDLNGDGSIDKVNDLPEGEDYVHPVFAMLKVQKAGTSSTAPDLAVEDVRVDNAFTGETAGITFTLRNLGAAVSGDASITFSVDGQPVSTQQVAVDRSGVQQVSGAWKATAGSHEVSVRASVAGDFDASNDVASVTTTVGSLPDLALTLGQPFKPGATTSEATGSPLLAALSVLSVGLAAWLLARRPPGRRKTLAVLALLGAVLAVAFLVAPSVTPTARAKENTVLYLLPVTVKNVGGSDAPGFNLTVYLDGEKLTIKNFDRGVQAGNETKIDLPVYASPGSHQVKAVIDEAARIRDANRANNVAESAYGFP